MTLSWTKARSGFKSPLRVVARFVWRSREVKAQQCRRLSQQLGDARRMIARLEAKTRRKDEEILVLKQQVRRLEEEKREQAAAFLDRAMATRFGATIKRLMNGLMFVDGGGRNYQFGSREGARQATYVCVQQ